MKIYAYKETVEEAVVRAVHDLDDGSKCTVVGCANGVVYSITVVRLCNEESADFTTTDTNPSLTVEV
jgi:hypothetical protein